MKKEQLLRGLLLMLAAAIWGFAFVAQSVAMDHVKPFLFNGSRSFLGALAILPVAIITQKQNEKKNGKTKEEKKKEWKLTLLAGVVCGLCLFTASSLQQVGLVYTTPGKAGFLTACYIVAVPVIGIFLKKGNGIHIWISVLLALVGLYLLCITKGTGLAINLGDGLVMLCAVVFALHILSVDYFVDKVNPCMISFFQFIVCGLISLPVSAIFERQSIFMLKEVMIPFLYAGILSSGVAYTLQIVGQKNMNPTIASLLMSLESVFSVVGALLILHQGMSTREAFGCVFVFVAVVLAQLPLERKKEKEIQ